MGHKIIYSELHIIWTIKLHTPIRNPITCAWLKPLFQQASAHNLKISEEEESTTFIGILSQHLIIPTVKALGLILKWNMSAFRFRPWTSDRLQGSVASGCFLLRMNFYPSWALVSEAGGVLAWDLFFLGFWNFLWLFTFSGGGLSK